jgi:hypothetical protein
MKTATIKFIQGDGFIKPNVEGNFEFILSPKIDYDKDTLVPSKLISFPWCIEIPQDIDNQPNLNDIFEIFAEKLKQDFLVFLKTKALETDTNIDTFKPNYGLKVNMEGFKHKD